MIDKTDDPMGRIDGMVIVDEEGKRGEGWEGKGGSVVRGGRLGKRIGRWVRLAAMKWGLRRGERTRVAWKDVRWIEIEVKVDVDGDQMPALEWEHWLGEKLISKLPRSK